MGKLARLVLTILLFLGLGLVTSVAIAWVAAVQAQVNYGPRWGIAIVRGTARYENDPRTGQPDESQPPRFSSDETTNPIIPLHPLDALKINPGDHYYQMSSGWPWRCLSSAAIGRIEPIFDPAAKSVGMMYGGLTYGGLYGSVQMLPVSPVWGSLARSAAFWGVIWGLLLLLPGARRWSIWKQQRRKGRCGWCNYDMKLAPSAVCPECGKNLKARPQVFAMPSLILAMVVLVLFLIGETGFSSYFRSHSRIMAIHRAAIQGDLEVVKAELARGVDIDIAMLIWSYQGCTPLMLATWSGHEDIVNYLLDNNADVGRVTRNQGNALSIAIANGEFDLARRLIEAGVPIETFSLDYHEPLFKAIETGELEMVRTLVEKGANVNMLAHVSVTPLHYLLFSRKVPRESRIEIAKYLLAVGADPNLPADPIVRRPISSAIIMQNLELVRELLEAGANADDYRALGDAVSRSKLEALELLLERGADLARRDPASGVSLWWEAARLNLEDVYAVWERLAESGADVNSIKDGRSLLTDAVIKGHDRFARYLLDHGADPTFRDSDGKRAVDYFPPDTTAIELKTLLDEYEAKWIAEHGEAASRGESDIRD